MGVTIPITIPVPQSCSFFKKHPHFHPSIITSSLNLRNRSYNYSTPRTSSLWCCCSMNINNVNDDWDWKRWINHFSEIQQAESFSSLLQFQLEEAVEKEDFQEAAKLKSAIAEVSSKDTVAEIMSELEKAIAEERYHDASKLSRTAGSNLVGWWIGSAKDSGDPFGRLVRITPGVGKFVGCTYTPRQLVSASPGTTLFEIYVVKTRDDSYAMQVVYLQRSKGKLTDSASLQPKPTRESSDEDYKSSSITDVGADAQTKVDTSEKQEERVLNIEGATEEGIKSVINFLADKIPGLKVKVVNIKVDKEVVEDGDALNQSIQEDSENSDDESDDFDETDRLTMEANGNAIEDIKDGKDLDMQVFVGGTVQNEDDVASKEEYVRLPAQIMDAEKDSFILHVPGILKNVESEVANYKLAALAAKGVSELMPADVTKAFVSNEKLLPKVSRDVREIIKLAISQAQKRNNLSEYTKFDRIKIPRDNLDPFEGLYVGAFGPHGTEIVQLKRKFGRWSSGDDLEKPSDIEFYEYVEAVKLTGDFNVPAGQVTFRAKIGKVSRLSNRNVYPPELGVVASYKGQGRISEPGFKNPKWVEGELLQLNGKGIGPSIRGADLGFLYIVPEQSFLVIFTRLNLPE